MAPPDQDNFSNVLKQPFSCTLDEDKNELQQGTTELINRVHRFVSPWPAHPNRDIVIEIEDQGRIFTPGRGVPESGTVKDSERKYQRSLCEIDELDPLSEYNLFYLDYDYCKDLYVRNYLNIIGGDPNSENVIFKVARVVKPRPNRGWKSADISNTKMNFIDGNSKIVFSSDRTQFKSQVKCDKGTVGEISGGGSCGCDRSFKVTCHISNKTFELKPQGICAGFPFSWCNPCLITEYFIYDMTVGGSNKIGSITCGEKIEVNLNLNSGEFRGLDLDNASKAVLLAASMVIFELYFAPSFGNVGEMGRQCLCATFCLIPPVIIAIAVLFVFVYNKFWFL